MNDPYSVLGVSPSASDDDVKKAYRELARKYHPDNYHDNPLADLASEKMKEINEAYDTITKSREGGSSYSGGSAYQSQGYQQSYSGASGSGYGGSANAAYTAIRNLINANQLDQAMAMLNSIPGHDAEWNYLMGSIYWRRGWMDEAARYFRTAATMEPNNIEYRNAVQYMNRGGQAYRSPVMNSSMTNNVDVCTICQTLYCADCCCELMGGDFIRCC